MPVLPRALEIQGEIAAIRRGIHAHPELAYEEKRTSDIVAAKLEEWGLEVTRGLGKTGLVGTLRKGNEHRPGYPPTVNNVERARFAIDVAAGVCGEHAVQDNVRPSMGAEDFSYMLERVPGAMVWLGNGGGADSVSLHNSRYDFNDMAIPFGVSFFVRTVERFLGDKNS